VHSRGDEVKLKGLGGEIKIEKVSSKCEEEAEKESSKD
jgi:hypothetical protein